MNEQQTTTSKKLIVNTMFNMLTVFSCATIGFFMMPFFLDHLGETRYGIWLLIASVFRYRNVLSMGLNSSVNRYIPMFLAKNDNEQVSRVVSTSSFYYLILCSVIVLCSLLLYWKVDDWFAIEPNLVETARRLALLTGICLAAATGMQCFSAVLSGLQRYDLVNIAVLVPILIRTILLIWLLSHGCGLIGMGLLFGRSEIGIRLLHLYWARKHLSMFSLSLRHVDFGLLRDGLVRSQYHFVRDRSVGYCQGQRHYNWHLFWNGGSQSICRSNRRRINVVSVSPSFFQGNHASHK